MTTRKLQKALNVAWAAGLFEGEGHIAVKQETRATNPRFGYTPTYVGLTLSSTDEDVLMKFFHVVDCGGVNGPYQRQGNKPHWVWDVTTAVEVERVLNEFMPYLGERRSLRAIEALAADTRNKPKPVKVCCKCDGELNGSHTSYCKQCFAAYVRARKAKRKVTA